MTTVPGGSVLLGPTPPGATRRTTTIVISPLGDWASGQHVVAQGRDLHRSASDAVRTEHDEFSFSIDTGGLVIPDESRREAGRTVPEELRGHPAQRGLRKRLAQLRADQLPGTCAPLGPEGGLYDALLDDVAGTSLASGYGRLYEGSISHQGSQISSSMRMNCVGFHTMHQHGEQFDVVRYFESKPRSIEFVPDDPLAWHVDPPMRPHTFRRRRMLQVDPLLDGDDAGTVAVTGYFRDTFMRPDGIESIVHEYGLDATVSGHPLILERLEARPGDLPLDHCPLAARSALTLEGLRLADVEESVRRNLVGPAGCTHLNDGLRSLRLVPTLLARRS